MSNSRLEDLLDLAHVPRWSRVPLLRPQSVAEHSFRVGAIALEICRRLNHFGKHNALGYANVVLEHRVLLWALVHDGPEAETGDVPYPTKKFVRDMTGIDPFSRQEDMACPWYRSMSHEVHSNEVAIIKIADKIEEVLFLNEWGMTSSPRTMSALSMATQLILDRCAEARERFGWTNPSILQIAAELVQPYDLIGYARRQTGQTVPEPAPGSEPGPLQPEPGSGPGGPQSGLPQT